ncbi:MAG TPA: UDP-N-acetylmuramate dehydrogenase [Deferrisomatales bacterium]|nr:UDP-N-acetylmuramate dehydrogenase [Deferrisomatales bacterium]
MARTTLDLIRETVRGEALFNEPMRDHTTIQVGGPADLLLHPADRDDLAALVELLAERGVPYFVLGNGSNLVVRDGGIRGAVICLDQGFRGVERRDAEDGRPRLWVEAGAALRTLVRWSVDQGISGFAEFAGIPAAVGGAIAMNAGAWGVSIGEQVEELEVMDRTGATHVYPREMLRFGYRSLDLPPDAIILGALLRGGESTPATIKDRAKELYRKRKESQPVREPSAGCVFRNPSGGKAGEMIDGCGLKGVRVGDAQISTVHANFIVNTGNATAVQVVSLVGMIQERVYVRHKIKLEPEVRIVGEWEKGKLRISE